MIAQSAAIPWLDDPEAVASAVDRGTRHNPAYLAADVVTVAELLERAQEEHKTWEAEHGPDPHWPTWYAKYLLGLDVTPANREESS